MASGNPTQVLTLMQQALCWLSSFSQPWHVFSFSRLSLSVLLKLVLNVCTQVIFLPLQLLCLQNVCHWTQGWGVALCLMPVCQVFLFFLLLPLACLVSPWLSWGVTWDLSGDFDGTINGVSLEGGFVSINWVAKPNRNLTGPEVRISKPRWPLTVWGKEALLASPSILIHFHQSDGKPRYHLGRENLN